MTQITIEHNVSPVKLDTLAVDSWPTWSKEISEFEWHYDQTEMCYILDGEATITPESGEVITIVEGDLVTFPQGLSCTWRITADINKHYIFK